CYYMKDRLGETFAGTISSVTSFGIFVALDDVYVEGLVHISDLGQDYFKYDKDRHQIVGERTRKRYQLADRVNVKVVRVDIETSKIDFTLAGERLKTVKETEALDAPPWQPSASPAQPRVAPILQRGAKPASSKSADTEIPKVAPSAPKPVAVPVAKTAAAAPDAVPSPSGKVIMTVSSANPPTTPLAGLPPKSKSSSATGNPGALLGKKMNKKPSGKQS
ncbi:MAG: S1 RNA-binding domain-containing protein, partial [Burkholderiales bacterium]